MTPGVYLLGVLIFSHGGSPTMNPTAKALGIDRLSVDERLRLVEAIWDSIAESVDSMALPESHKAELDRRLAAMDANPTAGSSWEEVKGRLQRGRENP
jgi:putative addiction module component (TIGR02574 family)